jgi:hypothetical protein
MNSHQEIVFLMLKGASKLTEGLEGNINVAAEEGWEVLTKHTTH